MHGSVINTTAILYLHRLAEIRTLYRISVNAQLHFRNEEEVANWKRLMLEKMIVPQLLKKFQFSYTA
jgi:collagenase-like PrtC family protease